MSCRAIAIGLLLSTCAFFGSILHVQAARPAAGITVDETRSVALLAVPPKPCASIDLPGATVLLDKAALERLAVTKPVSWTTELERQAFIAAQRAEGLLRQLAPSLDGLGCFPLAGRIGAEAQHVVLSALESGTAGVRDAATGAMVATASIRYLGDRCGPTCGRGAIEVSLPTTNVPFLVLQWWVS